MESSGASKPVRLGIAPDLAKLNGPGKLTLKRDSSAREKAGAGAVKAVPGASSAHSCLILQTCHHVDPAIQTTNRTIQGVLFVSIKKQGFGMFGDLPETLRQTSK